MMAGNKNQQTIGIPLTPSTLCTECQTLIDNAHVDFELSNQQEHFNYHDTWSAVKLSAEKGCGICLHFIHNVGDTVPDEADVLEEERSRHSIGEHVVAKDRVGRVLRDSPGIYTLYTPYNEGDVDPVNDEDFLGYISSSLKIHRADKLAIAYDVLGSQSKNTQDALPTCKRWLQKCKFSHKSCKQNAGQKVPTRLLYIRGDCLQLRLNTEIPSGVTYATLSHCWGPTPHQFVKLEKKTLGKFQRCISIEDLTETFRNAICISQTLGFEYLWIDSLCIIQDDKEDWVRESALMTEVYLNSELNIAATSAENGSVGCFFDRGKNPRCQVQSSDKCNLFDVYRMDHTSPRRNPLGERAWVVQERYLSRRILHFAEEQVFWECNEISVCETYPDGYPIDVSPNEFDQKKLPTLQSWPEIVEAYSKCRLTHDTDKLVAIAGLARRIQKQTRDTNTYIAGLWRNQLEGQLLWHIPKGPNGFLQNSARIPLTNAPTWSWASINGPIEYGYLGNDHMLINVKSLHCESTNRGTFVDVANATLRLLCESLYSVLVCWRYGDFEAYVECVFYFQDTPSGEEDIASNTSSDLDHGHKITLHFDHPKFSQGPYYCEEAYLLPVRECDEIIYGLLLEDTSQNNAEKGRYRRIGYFELDSWIIDDAHDEKNLVWCDLREYFTQVSTTNEGTQYFIDII